VSHFYSQRCPKQLTEWPGYSGDAYDTGMERHREGRGPKGVRSILAKGRLFCSRGVSVRQFCLKFPVHSLISLRMNLEALGKTKQLRTFYGTQCICDLGVKDSSFCDWKSCGICLITKSSFTTFEFGGTGNSGRYGKGIYSYLDPSMADRFATSSLSSPFRAVLACEVNIPAVNSNASKSPIVAKSVSKSTTSSTTDQSSPILSHSLV
jgi:hypothetical protein